MSVIKIDGIGTRKNGTGGESINTSVHPKKIITMIGFSTDGAAAVTYTKGDAVALQIATALVGATDILTTFGVGNAVKLATELTELLCVGIVTETVTATYNSASALGSHVIVPVQVSGRFVDANVATGTTVGLQMFPTATDGRLALNAGSDADTHKPLAIALENATSNTCDIILLNPLSY